MSSSLPDRFTYPFCYTPHPLIADAARRLIEEIDASPRLHGLFSEGKMMGVMLVSCDGSIPSCICPATADEDRRFGAAWEDNATSGLRSDLAREDCAASGLCGDLRWEDCAASGLHQCAVIDGRRVGFLYAFSGNVSGINLLPGFVPPIYNLLDEEGHFRREERRISDINLTIASLSGDDPEAATLKRLRKQMSEELQDWIFRQFVVLNGRGESLSIKDIFASRGLLPPSGTGECAAPKLLQYAYRHSLKPLAMGEFWYGDSPVGEVRRQGSFYPSCLGKCGPLLEYMMQGLSVEDNPLEKDFCFEEPRIIYRDEVIVVVDKPSGMLSVPGRGDRVSLLGYLERQLNREVFSCHRLDMDTSGLMVYALSPEAKKILEGEFARREVCKSYLARLLPGTKTVPRTGTITLPLAPDWYDRPRQMVDFKQGKEAVTDFELLRMLPDGGAIVRFTPHTGRTHQIRVHSAHRLGFGRPIKGDRLYGDAGGGRLMLHACDLEFTHPATGLTVRFTSESSFE